MPITIAASRLWRSGQLQSTCGRCGSTSRPGRTPIDQRPGEDRAGDDRVEERLDDQRRAERRVGRVLDAVLDEVELEHVAAAGGDDRVDADAGEVGAEDASAAGSPARGTRRG